MTEREREKERERERERVERWAAVVDWRRGPVDWRRGSCVGGGLGRLRPVTLRPAEAWLLGGLGR